MRHRRPKDIGTAAETAVVRAARRNGFPNADRLTTTGTYDRGDVRLTTGLTAGVVVEVKAGQQATKPSDKQIMDWLREVETEKINAGAAVAFLVTKRAGVGASNAHNWWAWWHQDQFLELIGMSASIPKLTPVCTLLGSTFALLQHAGYGWKDDNYA